MKEKRRIEDSREMSKAVALALALALALAIPYHQEELLHQKSLWSSKSFHVGGVVG